MIAPGRPTDPIQYIDGRDLAGFVLHTAESQIEGIFNVVSSPGEYTIGELLDVSKATNGSDAELVWIEKVEDFDLEPWADLPAWVSPTSDAKGFATVSNRAAIDAGLTISSLQETVESIWTEIQNESPRQQDELKAGLKKDRESGILEKIAT